MYSRSSAVLAGVGVVTITAALFRIPDANGRASGWHHRLLYLAPSLAFRLDLPTRECPGDGHHVSQSIPRGRLRANASKSKRHATSSIPATVKVSPLRTYSILGPTPEAVKPLISGMVAKDVTVRRALR
ncbi:hypothetical protein EDB80DRAFT_61305 [Ilyonectria destructans]|nr:hypothetical protein EDB80DRAFT_61305 [Ilyonectria destructans]